jgi:hypothetical protein
MIDIIDNAKEHNYKIIYMQPKQLSYRDYFFNNVIESNTKSRSSCILLVDQTIDISYNRIKEKSNDLLHDTFPKKLTDKYVIQDLIINNYAPIWTLTLLEDDYKFKSFVSILSIVKIKKHKIPDYICNYEDLIFWFSKINDNKYPKMISTINKFKEYKSLCQTIDNNNIDYLKQHGIIPIWINNNDDAEKYIWLDFSTINKKWKENRSSYIMEINIQSGNNSLSDILFN